MSVTLAAKTLSTSIAEALATYKELTGVTLAPGDPRRLHLVTIVTLMNQQRGVIDFAGKQSLLSEVSDEFIDELAELWGEERLPAAASTCTQRFHFPLGAPLSVPAGLRVTDGINTWAVKDGGAGATPFVDLVVECIDTGDDSNGVAIGQIDTVVDPDLIPGITTTENLTETTGGRNLESLESFRERLRDVPENQSTCGPRGAYEALAKAVSATVADAVALGPDDAYEMDSYHGTPDPGEVFVFIIEGTRDEDGTLETVVPEPSDSLLAAVDEALSAETVRPLTDSVYVLPAVIHDVSFSYNWYIARSREDSVDEITEAVDKALQAFQLWQQSKIGRDINPDELRARLVNAGAKRIENLTLAYTALARNESCRITGVVATYSGVEDD